MKIKNLFNLSFLITTSMVIFLMVLLLLGTKNSDPNNVESDSKDQQMECLKEDFNPKEYTSFDLFFSDTYYDSVNCKNRRSHFVGLPDEALKALKDYPDSYKSVAEFDLNYDGINEYIVQGSAPSGGTQFYFIQKQKDKWRVIACISGGFVLSYMDDSVKKGFNKSYIKITSWHRFGKDDTWQYELLFKKNEYEVASEQAIPLVLLHKKDFIQMMLDLNGFQGYGDWN